MKKINESQRKLIDAIIEEKIDSGLTPAILEKDVHVTEALHALFAIKHPHIDLIFCGGTSLSKAHGIIERMSEDIDLKVKFSSDAGMSKNAKENYLRSFKDEVAQQMCSLGFEEDLNARETRNRNQYVTTSWEYESCYQNHESLRPHLKLEYTVRTPAFPTSTILIGHLVNKIAEQHGTELPINCIAIEEILAEKVLSFLRRYAQYCSGNMQRPWDTALVRHIYDVYCIVQTDSLAIKKAKNYFADIVKFDITEFTQHPAFTQDSKTCLSSALTTAETDMQINNEYQTRLLPLIYGKNKPGFAEAFQLFKTSSHELLSAL